MRLFSLLCAALVVFIVPVRSAEAQTFNPSEFPIEGSEDLFTRDLFRITRCMAEKDRDEVQALMADRSWSFVKKLALQEIAKRNGSCITRGTQLRGSDLSFRGGLAAGLFLDKYEDARLPSYAGIPQVFTLDNIGTLSPKDQATELSLALNECAFRIAPQAARDFLDSEPASKEAISSYDGVLSAFKTCLQGGEMPAMSRVQSRSIMALAAYYVDLAYGPYANGAA